MLARNDSEDKSARQSVTSKVLSQEHLNALRYGLCEKIGDSSHTRRYKPASRPDEAYVSGVAYKFVQNGDDVRMPEIIGKRDLGEQADSHTGEHASPDRFDTVGREISAHGRDKSTFWSYKRPMR